jgi:hypothetical protein
VISIEVIGNPASQVGDDRPHYLLKVFFAKVSGLSLIGEISVLKKCGEETDAEWSEI